MYPEPGTTHMESGEHETFLKCGGAMLQWKVVFVTHIWQRRKMGIKMEQRYREGKNNVAIYYVCELQQKILKEHFFGLFLG